MTSLEDLLDSPASQPELKAKLIAALKDGGIETTDWGSTSFERAFVEGDSTALYDVGGSLVPTLAAGADVLTARDAGLTEWVRFVAYHRFGLSYVEAVATQGQVVLTAAPDAGPYTIAVGQFIAASDDGHQYTNVTGGTLAKGSTLTLTFEALATGAEYDVASGAINTLLTPLPGVTASNPSRGDVSAGSDNTGSGTLTITTDGEPTASSIGVRVTVNGAPGSLGIRYSIGGVESDPISVDGSGVVVVPSGATPSAGVDVTMEFDGVFDLGDTFAWSLLPWVTRGGSDAESNDSLAERCLARWPSLSLVPNEDVYALWAKAGAPQDVTKVRVVADPDAAATVNVYLAGPAGPVDGTPPNDVVAKVQDYLDGRAGVTDLPAARNTSAKAVSITGVTVYVTTGQRDPAQKAAQATIRAYVDAAPIGGYTGLGVDGGIVAISEVIGALTNAPGVQRVVFSTMNLGGGVGADLPLLEAEVATWDGQLGAGHVTWVEV